MPLFNLCKEEQNNLEKCNKSNRELLHKLQYYESNDEYEKVEKPKYDTKYYVKVETSSYPNYKYLYGTYKLEEKDTHYTHSLYVSEENQRNQSNDRVPTFIYDTYYRSPPTRLDSFYYIEKSTDKKELEEIIKNLSKHIIEMEAPHQGGSKYNRTRKNMSRNSAHKNRRKSKYYRK